MDFSSQVYFLVLIHEIVIQHWAVAPYQESTLNSNQSKQCIMELLLIHFNIIM